MDAVEAQRLLSSAHAEDWTYASMRGVHVRKGRKVKERREKLGSSLAQLGPARPSKGQLLLPGPQAVLCTPGAAGPPSLSSPSLLGL